MKTKFSLRIPQGLYPAIRSHRRLFVGAIVALSVSLWTVSGVSAWFLHDVVTTLPDKTALRQVGTMAQATLLLDAHDAPAFTIFREQRIEVPLSRVSPHLVRAIVAIEDQRFYEHRGIDLVRVAGALVTNLREGRRAQGGSTITQQLARQSFLTLDKTFRRKVKEMILAARLEREFTKDEILQLYLNKVYFGDGLYGAEAASLGYFGKSAADLDIAEAALLAGLVKSPSTYAPTVSPERALARRNLVLQQMRQTGVLGDAEYEQALARPLELSDALRREEGFGLYFKEEVRKQLVDRFGWERVYQGGLKVYTTIDPATQKAAEAEVQRTLAEIEKRQEAARRRGEPAPTEPLQAALVAMDPRTGEVRALVGGRDFNESAFNRAVQARRQPGSAFKPFVYAAALESGFSPATLLTDLNEPVMTLQGEWVPEDEHLESPTITMRMALRTSSNRAAVKMLEQVGIPEAVAYAKRLGVGSVPSVPSLALGSGEVTLLSMTAAYGAFANRGVLPVPTFIRRVEALDGTVLYEAKPEAHRAVSEETAFLITTMLADVVDAGTAWTARREGFTLPAAGKTGTTNDYHDAWFVGYTPRLVAGVWVGYDQPKTIIGNGYAGQLAVPMWGRFMRTATRSHRAEWYSPPNTITTANICRLSGQLAGEGCRDVITVDEEDGVRRESMAYTEYFVRGTEPTEYCELHNTRHSIFAAVPSIPGSLGEQQQPTTGVRAPDEDERERDRDRERDRENARENDNRDGEREAEAKADEQPTQPEQRRRRGFWGRLFGRD